MDRSNPIAAYEARGIGNEFSWKILIDAVATAKGPDSLTPHWRRRMSFFWNDSLSCHHTPINTAKELSYVFSDIAERLDPKIPEFDQRIRLLWKSFVLAIPGTPLEEHPGPLFQSDLFNYVPCFSSSNSILRQLILKEGQRMKAMLLKTRHKPGMQKVYRWIAILKGVNYKTQSEAEALVSIATWDDTCEVLPRSDIEQVIQHVTLDRERNAILQLLDAWKGERQERTTKWAVTPPAISIFDEDVCSHPFLHRWPAEFFPKHFSDPRFQRDLGRLLAFLSIQDTSSYSHGAWQKGECPTHYLCALCRTKEPRELNISQLQISEWWDRVCEESRSSEDRRLAVAALCHLSRLGRECSSNAVMQAIVDLTVQDPLYREDLIYALFEQGGRLRIVNDLEFKIATGPFRASFYQSEYIQLALLLRTWETSRRHFHLLAIRTKESTYVQSPEFSAVCNWVLGGLEGTALPPKRALEAFKLCTSGAFSIPAQDAGLVGFCQGMVQASRGMGPESWPSLDEHRERVKDKEIWKEGIVTFLSACLGDRSFWSNLYRGHDYPGADKAYAFRDILQPSDFEAIASFIVEGTPVPRGSGWDFFSDRESVSLADLPGLRAQALGWKSFFSQDARNQIAKSFWEDPAAFFNHIGSRFKAEEFHLRWSGHTKQNFSVIPHVFMWYHQHPFLQNPCQDPLHRALKEIQTLTRDHQPTEGTFPSLRSPAAIGRTLVEEGEGPRLAVKVQRKGESDDAFMREYFFLQTVAPLLKSKLPEAVSLHKVSTGVPAHLAEQIKDTGIEVASEPLVLVMRVESTDYWAYPDVLTDEEWDDAQKRWIEDEMALLRAEFVHEDGLAVGHCLMAETGVRSYLFTGIPATYKSRGRIFKALDVPHPNFGKDGFRDPDGHFLDEIVEDLSLISSDLKRWLTIGTPEQKKAYIIANKMASVHWAATAVEMRRRQSREEFDYQDSNQVASLATYGKRVMTRLFAAYLQQPEGNAELWCAMSGVDWEQYARELLYWLQPESYVPDIMDKEEMNPDMMPEGMKASVDLSWVVTKSPEGFRSGGTSGGALDISGMSCPLPLFQSTLIWDLCGMAPIFRTALDKGES